MASTSASNDSSESGLIDQFCCVTGADKDRASKMLEACSWNLEMAINMHVDSDYYQDLNSTRCSGNTFSRTVTTADGVRAPIPPTRGVLVEGGLTAQFGFRGAKRRGTSVFDGFRDIEAETRWQELIADSPVINSESYKKRRTLEDLFRPPLDIMHRGSFESARDVGQSTNRWLMVNIHDSQEFACQVLNRDIWSNRSVKEIISKHFIFWQVYCDSAEGQRYMQFYKPVDFPYIAVLDPRTGENLVVWNKVEQPAAFCELLNCFLNEHASPEGQCHLGEPVLGSLLDVSEEQQIRAAMEASLKEVASSSIADEESDVETFDSDTEGVSKVPEVNAPDSKSDSTNDIDVVNCSESLESTSDTDESWKQHLGCDSDPTTELVLRLPDGKREQIRWPCTSKLEALQLFVETFGYSQKNYELVTNFPRKNLSDLELTKTLKDVGLYPRETIFVQLKNL